MFVVVWIVTGLLLGVVGRAVSPAWQAPGVLLCTGLGVAGGLGGGLLIHELALRSVAGFTAGEVGAIMGASVLLIAGSVLTAPPQRPA
jgi:uncharacterized membrane protein YeaQ/YmgE (transglycosylase-associated protein family)